MVTLLLCNAKHYASLEGHREDEDAKYAHPLKWKPEHQADADGEKRMLRLKGMQSIVALHTMPQGKITVFLHLYSISNNLFSSDGQLFIKA